MVEADALVNKIISMGLEYSASDIHIESQDNSAVIRFRIDGVLREPNLGIFQDELNRKKRQLISRIKILGNMDIAEKRRPQDGSFRARITKDGKAFKIDFRISIIPGYYGENAVLRILDNRNAPKSIDQLTFSKKITNKLHQLLKKNTGLILITGPTGSGKSTTLYGALMTLYQPGIKILTAEDPIEYVYDNITQCEVNYKIGNTFASYIRAFLRQDPEVIMVGEIRDSETAEMAFGAAQTGHLVLSTLHTNDAISSVTRLLGLEVDSNLITSCLLGVVSQRLVRKICSHCKREYVPTEELLREFFDMPPSDIQWFKGQKCSFCEYTGYNGRIAVAQIWTPNENDVILINKGASIDEIRKSSSQSTLLMIEDAMRLLRDGKTNLEEIIRTLPYSNIYESRQILKSMNLD
jgi:type IV pilus assembly protein PilB